MSLNRASRFLKRVLVITLLVAAVIGSLVAIQLIAHPFNPEIKLFSEWIAAANTVISENLMAGISLGMIVLVLVVALLPLAMKNVNRSQYFVAVQRGVIASLVFFLTQALYNWAESFNRFYLIVAMVGVIIVTFVVVETLSLLMHSDRKEEAAFRTDLLASFAAGLVSGIVIKLITVAFGIH